jgi:alkanesulfonate monooxygenase SsuD/methylene tetrahydromethanopterin reductase-like flavin-dependent oxidoreductase (luciferase family)
MSDPTIGLKLPTTGGSPDGPVNMTAGEWGARAEELGYDSIWGSEAWGSNIYLELADVAVHTDDLRLCTAIVNTYSRTPPVHAMAGATLQRLSGGRAVIGIGPSHAPVVERLHGVPYERPVRRTHEAIELIKALTGGGDDVNYDGQVFSSEGFAPFDEEVPVYNAALGEANRRATGRVADGWLPYIFPVSSMDDAFETIADTARERGRDPADLEVTPQILAAVDDDPAVAKDYVRDYVAGYVGGLPNYRNAIADEYADEAEAIGTAWDDGGREAAMAAIPDELLFEVAVAGTEADVQDQFRDILETDIVDCPIVYVPRDVPAAERDRTIEALSPSAL